jgi:hypothetical protein
VPFVSFAVLGLATAKRRSCKRAALEIALGASISVISTLLGGAVAFYVAVSDQVTGGLAGLVINGKDRRIAAHVPDSTAANTSGPLLGLLMPRLLVAVHAMGATTCHDASPSGTGV